MKKIVSLFKRDYDGTRLVYDEIVESAEWVTCGEGVPTRKWDGTACLVRDGKLYKRYDCKRGKTPPSGFEPAEPAPNEHTGHWPGWVPVGDGPNDRWHREAFVGDEPDGTYELIGPKVQGNPEGMECHVLVQHGAHLLIGCPHNFDGLKTYLTTAGVEGVVWHHPDGRMVKIKAKDFGLVR